MEAEATIVAMNIIQWALERERHPNADEAKMSKVGQDILVSALGHLRRSLREYLTRGGK